MCSLVRVMEVVYPRLSILFLENGVLHCVFDCCLCCFMVGWLCPMDPIFVCQNYDS